MLLRFPLHRWVLWVLALVGKRCLARFDGLAPQVIAVKLDQVAGWRKRPPRNFGVHNPGDKWACAL
jgi:hypothetical protein